MENSKSKDLGILWLPDSISDWSMNRVRERSPACSGQGRKLTMPECQWQSWEGKGNENEAQRKRQSSTHHPNSRYTWSDPFRRVPLQGGTDRKRCVPGLDRNLGNWKEINCSPQQVSGNGLETSQDSCEGLQGKPKECNGIPFSEPLSACVGCEVDYTHGPHGEATENTQLQQCTDHIPQILLVCLWNAK